jgi:hypothetical protein
VITIADPRDHDPPISTITMAGTRNKALVVEEIRVEHQDRQAHVY